MNPSGEIMWVHAVRVVAIFFVVWVHSAAQVFFFGAPFNSFSWWVANVYDSSVRVCVPMLFMLSGFLLLGKTEPLGLFLRKRLHKVVIPLLAWSLFFVVWIHYYEFQHPSLASSMTPDYLGRVYNAGWGVLLGMLLVPVYYHLWFLYVLFGMYLLMPLLRHMVQNASRQTLWYFVGLSVFTSGVLPALEHVAGAKTFIHLDMASGAMGYLVLGYLLGDISVSKRMFHAAIGAFLAATAIAVWGTYYLTARKGGVLDQTFWGETPNIMVASIAMFLMIRYMIDNIRFLASEGMRRWMVRLSSASFGIYLVHVMFIYAFAEGMFGFRLSAQSGNPIIIVPVIALLTFAASYAVIAIMQKIPVVRHTVP